MPLSLVLDLLGDVLSPPACCACNEPLTSWLEPVNERGVRPKRNRAVFCLACASSVVRSHETVIRTAFSPAGNEGMKIHAFGLFGGALATAIRRLKFDPRPDFARPLSDLVRHALRAVPVAADVVVPVPLHPLRLAERGFNQAALLGRPIARELGVDFAPTALARVRNTARQVELPRNERLQNVVGAFEMRGAGRVRGRRVALVDDVATTGATLAACRDALLAGGALLVTAIVVARAERAADGAETDRGGSTAARSDDLWAI